MNEEQIRLACMDMAYMGNNPRGSPQERAAEMETWVAGSEIRLGCLRLAIKQFGNLARIGMDRVLDESAKILRFVDPPKPMSSVPARKRGRPRK